MTRLKTIRNLLSFPMIVILLTVLLILWISKPYIQISFELDGLVKNEILPSSEYIIDYSIKGQYGSILNIKLSDSFDNLPLRGQWQELKKIMGIYDESRWSIVAKNNSEIFDNIDTNFLPDIIANTSKHKYEFSSINSITVNDVLYLQEQVLYGVDFFEIKTITFNPPLEVDLVETNSTILAANTRDYLIDYEMFSDWRSTFYNHPKATQMLDDGNAYFLAEARVLLLEYYGDFAKIRLLENQFGKNKGYVCWVRKGNIQE